MIKLRNNTTYEYNTGDTLPTLGETDKGITALNVDTEEVLEWDGSAWVTPSSGAILPETWTGTVIPLNNTIGAVNNTATWNATYTTISVTILGSAVGIIDTTGQTVFPTITGATLLSGSAFVPTSTFEMHVYSTNGTNVFYYFLERA